MVNTKYSILFRCDGSHDIGFGHIVRCIALADELRDSHGCHVVFAVLRDYGALEMIKNHDYQVETVDPNEDQFSYGEWFNSVAEKNDPNVIILDVRDNLPSHTICNLRKQGIVIVTIDDPSDRRLLADLAFYPPAPQVKQMDWPGFTGRLYIGWEWVVLRREFAQKHKDSSMKKNENRRSKIPNILVTMGGSDPKGMTLKAIKALTYLGKQFEATIVLGPGFVHRDSINDLLKGFLNSFRVYNNVSNMADIMANADLALASFGVTAYELAAMGVPAVYLCLTEDHVQAALMFQNSGLAVSLGLADYVTDDEVMAAVKYFMNNGNSRLKMANQSRKSIDGRGAMRIAQLVTSAIGKGGCMHEPQVG
jgi:spore coat polysaccharide biosynthesis protein SpsF